MSIGLISVPESNTVKVGDTGVIDQTGETVKVISVKETKGYKIATWVTVPKKGKK